MRIALLIALAGCAKAPAPIVASGPLPAVCPSAEEHDALGLPNGVDYATIRRSTIPTDDYDTVVDFVLTKTGEAAATYQEGLPDTAAAAWANACVLSHYRSLVDGISPPDDWDEELRADFQQVVAGTLGPISKRLREKALFQAERAAEQGKNEPWASRAERLAQSSGRRVVRFDAPRRLPSPDRATPMWSYTARECACSTTSVRLTMRAPASAAPHRSSS